MKIIPSKRVQSIGAYAFAEIDRKVAELKEQGIQAIDFGVGDPTTPTPAFIRDEVKKSVDKHASSGYPSYIGSLEFRRTVAEWSKKRFSVSLDPSTEICSTIGSKEAIFHFPEGFINPGELVLVPTPGYPPFTRGTLFAEGRVYYYPLLEENRYLPDLERIPEKVAQEARIIWINYPNNPTGAAASLDFYQKVVDFGRKYNIIVASDEAYSELYFGEPSPSILQVTKEGVCAFHSLSKRSAMTGYRVGWLAGDQRIVEIFKKVKTNIDSGTPNFIQDAAIKALQDETHVEEMRREYQKKRDILREAFSSLGFPDSAPDATIHYWQKLPSGISSLDFATRLLQPEIAIVATPGVAISDTTEEGLNPGEGYIRFSLVPSIEETQEAAERLKGLKL